MTRVGPSRVRRQAAPAAPRRAVHFALATGARAHAEAASDSSTSTTIESRMAATRRVSIRSRDVPSDSSVCRCLHVDHRDEPGDDDLGAIGRAFSRQSFATRAGTATVPLQRTGAGQSEHFDHENASTPTRARRSRGAALRRRDGRHRVSGRRWPGRKRRDRSPAGCPGRNPSGSARSRGSVSACRRA